MLKSPDGQEYPKSVIRKPLQLQVECMRAAKAQKSALASENVDIPSHTHADESEPGPSGMNTCILLPAPNPDEVSLTENGESADGYGLNFMQEDADGVYRDWLVTYHGMRRYKADCNDVA